MFESHNKPPPRQNTPGPQALRSRARVIQKPVLNIIKLTFYFKFPTSNVLKLIFNSKPVMFCKMMLYKVGVGGRPPRTPHPSALQVQNLTIAEEDDVIRFSN